YLRLWGLAAAGGDDRDLAVTEFESQLVAARNVRGAADEFAGRGCHQRKATVEDRLVGNAAQQASGLFEPATTFAQLDFDGFDAQAQRCAMQALGRAFQTALEAGVAPARQ